MKTKSAELADGGAACMAIIQSFGVAGVTVMTPEQRVECKAKVEAL